MTTGLVTLVTLVAFEALAVSTAMPVAAQALGGVREYGLAFSLFLTTSLLGIVAAGGWTDRRGPREPVLVGLVLFAGGLLVSGTATSFEVMLLGRAVSGAGGGLQVVSLYVVVAAVYPQRVQPRVFGAISAAWVLPSVIGPPVAGFLATNVSWRAVFLVVPPLALLPLPVLWPRMARLTPGTHPSGTSPGLPTAPPTGPARPSSDGRHEPWADPPDDVRRRRAPKPDAVTAQPGIVRALGARTRVARGLGLAAGAVLLQWGLQGAGRLPAPVVVVAGALLAAVSAPALLPRGTFRLRRGLPSLVVARGVFTGTYFGAETFVPLMLVTQRGLSPTFAGLTLTAGAVGWSAGSFLQGRAILPLARTGLLSVGGLVVGLAILGLVPTPLGDVPPWVVAVVWGVGGLGMGLAMSSTSVLTLRLSATGEEGRNSSALQIGDAVGSVLGIGTAGAIFAALHTPGGDDSGAFVLIWSVLGVVGVLSSVVALRVATRP
ncbi:MAG: MFS transporter [Kineosporiaceae bacterium]